MSTQDVQNFALQVFQMAPQDIPVGVLRDAVNRFQTTGRINRRDVSDCIGEAGRAAEALPAHHDRPQGRGSAGPDPELKAFAQSIMDWYGPQVEELRMELFGSPEPPFQSFEASAKWIEEEYRLGNERETEREFEEYIARWEELGRLQHALCLYAERPIEFKVRDYTMTYFSVQPIKVTGQPDRHTLMVQELGLSLNSPLWTLKKFVMAMVSQTGFDEPRLVTWVLVGVPLTKLLPQVSVLSSPCPMPGQLPKTVITIWKSTVTNKDLREDAFQALKQFELLPYPRLKNVDLEIIKILKEVGPQPDKSEGRERYWSSAAKELERRGYQRISGDAVRMRCLRLSKTTHGRLLPSWLRWGHLCD